MNAAPQRLEHSLTDKGYVPVYAAGVIEQPWSGYTATDHHVWAQLYDRQKKLLVGRASDEFLVAQERMGMTADRIPRFDELNERLWKATKWQLVAVEGLLPELTFFEHLAAREFPVTWWIRKPEQMDYLSEPDLFHDLFGHVPLLMNPVFANYMRAYGLGGVKATGVGDWALQHLARLYWYTVEFGLIRNRDGDLRIYGSGILSSKGESLHCLESAAPNRIGFDLERVMRTRYRIDTYQKTYFVIDSFEELFEATRPDFRPLYARIHEAPSYAAGEVLSGDDVIQRGSGEGWLADGDV